MRLEPLVGEHFKPGADSDGPSLTQVWGAHLHPCFSDFHPGQRSNKPLTSLASPRFEILSHMTRWLTISNGDAFPNCFQYKGNNPQLAYASTA